MSGFTSGVLGERNFGLKDIFFSKYNVEGVQQFIKQYGSSGDDEATAIYNDGNGNLFVLGTVSGSFDGNTYYGLRDIVLIKSNTAGVKQFSMQFGTSAYDWGYSLIFDSGYNIYITGNTDGSLNGNTSKGSNDAFFAVNCYSTCQTCTFIGNSMDNKCISCKSGNFPLSNNLSTCKSGTVDGYYFDSGLNQYMTCYSPCETCTAAGNTTNHNCVNCKINYLKRSDMLTNCYNSPPNGYFLDVQTNYYTPCFSTCGSCSMVGNSTDHLCTTCNTNYYPQSNKLTNCYNSAPISYYFDTMNQQFKPCIQSCSSCTTLGDALTDHKCTTCNTNYYPLYDKQTNCYNSAPTGYFFETTGQQFKPCF